MSAFCGALAQTSVVEVAHLATIDIPMPSPNPNPIDPCSLGLRAADMDRAKVNLTLAHSGMLMLARVSWDKKKYNARMRKKLEIESV